MRHILLNSRYYVQLVIVLQCKLHIEYIFYKVLNKFHLNIHRFVNIKLYLTSDK